MKKKSRARVIILCSLASILLILFCVRVYSINTNFPPAVVERYTRNEPVNISAKSKYSGGIIGENVFQIVASNFKVYTTEELANKLQLEADNIPQDHFPQYQKRVALLQVSAKNISTQEQVIAFNQMNLQCSDLFWSSEIDYYWFKAANLKNPKMSMEASVKPGETVTQYLPYMILNAHFTNYDINKIGQEKFDLVLSLYPHKKLIKLNY